MSKPISFSVLCISLLLCFQENCFHFFWFARLDYSLSVKVADFGLTKQLDETEQYKMQDTTKALPVRWMSIETLQQQIYTTKSDVVNKTTEKNSV